MVPEALVESSLASLKAETQDHTNWLYLLLVLEGAFDGVSTVLSLTAVLAISTIFLVNTGSTSSFVPR